MIDRICTKCGTKNPKIIKKYPSEKRQEWGKVDYCGTCCQPAGLRFIRLNDLPPNNFEGAIIK